jgi:hypothetical protein
MNESIGLAKSPMPELPVFLMNLSNRVARPAADRKFSPDGKVSMSSAIVYDPNGRAFCR